MVTEDMIKDPINLYYFMSRVDALSGARNVLITDAGSNYYIGGQVFRFENGQRELTSGTFAAMDGDRKNGFVGGNRGCGQKARPDWENFRLNRRNIFG